MNDLTQTYLKSWIPFKLINHESDILFQWINVERLPFTDPFFDETILRCRRLSENSKQFKSVSNKNILLNWAGGVDSIQPTAFIFHVSRCGSTLVSQLLGMNEKNISLSEVPLFDEVLRIPFKCKYDIESTNLLFQACIKFYGQKRNGTEKNLFIKKDSWHLLFYDQLRYLYPDLPFIIMYRQPSEVLFSQERQKGTHAVKGLLEPGIFNFDYNNFDQIQYGEYMPLVLQKYYEKIVEISNRDKNVLLVDYKEGVSTIMKRITGFVGMQLSDIDITKFEERSRFHAKRKTEVFIEKRNRNRYHCHNIDILEELYNQIEMLRLQL